MSSAPLIRTLPKRGVARALAPSARRYASHGHGPQYNEPSGWLFGEKPLPNGQKRKRADWETPWYIGMYGAMGLAGLLLYYKPDTSIHNWALEEAKTRMEARGEKTEYP
ncbi:ESSS subunit of NADH:ubiquinone oxidoreductase [Irpex rosettiformis]|uniref:ESSS subunit of NADH:ubiquinone oxidoreductase n=1 Tax=Irpex rosettiformis TaxID=378272 RepID=A0ACB8UKL4_9APHY|nr:ESSS subunit of NADH:ubiquinone oxidoreductase [Irpex rosettiformis]